MKKTLKRSHVAKKMTPKKGPMDKRMTNEASQNMGRVALQERPKNLSDMGYLQGLTQNEERLIEDQDEQQDPNQ